MGKNIAVEDVARSGEKNEIQGTFLTFIFNSLYFRTSFLL
jgi:hypothetical protein